MAQVLVLAGGMATRLYPVTQTLPKCLIPFRGRPFIDYSLAWMASTGVRKVVLSIGYLSEQVIAYAQKLRIEGLEVSWVDEGNERLGTGGAIVKALPLLDDDFMVCYGDSFLPTDFGRVYRESQGASALMTVFRNEGRFDASNAKFVAPRVELYSKDKAVQERERFRYIDYGLTYWRKSDFAAWAPAGVKTWDLASLLSRLSTEGKLQGLEINERFYEVGSFSGHEEFESLLAGNSPICSKIKESLSKVRFL